MTDVKDVKTAICKDDLLSRLPELLHFPCELWLGTDPAHNIHPLWSYYLSFSIKRTSGRSEMIPLRCDDSR